MFRRRPFSDRLTLLERQLDDLRRSHEEERREQVDREQVEAEVVS